jgi:hypothetical protein
MGVRVIKKEHAHWWVIASVVLLGIIFFLAYHLQAY